MFPLLRLPLLAQYEVIRNMELYHILPLTQCSRRVKRIVEKQRIPIEMDITYWDVKKCLKFRKHKTYDNFIEMRIESRHRKPLKPCELWKIGDQVVEVENYSDILFTSWQDAWTGHKLILEFVASILNVKIASIFLYRLSPRDGFQVLEHSKLLGLNFGKINLDLLMCESGLAKSIFDTCANAEEFNFYFKTSHDFRYENFKIFSMNKLLLYNDPFVTVNDIIALNRVQDITLMNVPFSSRELNQILKMWTTGVVNFKCLRLYMMEYKAELDVVIEGLNAVDQPNGWYKVQRTDGIIAKIQVDESMGVVRLVDDEEEENHLS